MTYEHGRLHINLADLGPVQDLVGREVPLGHVQLKPMEFISIQDIDIRKGALVLLFRFEKDPLLENLSSTPPEGFYPSRERPERNARKMLPPPQDRVRESPAERALRLSRAVRSRGKGLLGRFRK